jgi:uncharacterized membrane protein YgdD (TMEM256/DUF423 family)
MVTGFRHGIVFHVRIAFTPRTGRQQIGGSSMRFWLAVAGLSGASAVLMGAWGAHGLQEAAAQRAWFDTAVMWHAIHAPALAAVAALLARSTGRRARLLHAAGALFALGTVLFSGTLYAMAIGGYGGFLAPTGGTMLALGWLSMTGAALVHGRTST